MKSNLLAGTLALLTSHIPLQACGGYGDIDYPPPYIAHEWGTFTSVQGADGIQLEWRPGIGNDLPSFVHSYLQPGSSASNGVSRFALTKGLQIARQRMETPVIYFYSAHEQKVNVRVDFPEGVVTEWFPRVSSFGPQLVSNPAPGKDSFIEWKNVQVLSRDARVTLPTDHSHNHYFAARATDANPIAFDDGRGRTNSLEYEKLLFYRGLGRFEAPLQSSLSRNEDRLVLRNAGNAPLAHLFVLSVHEGQAKFDHHAGLAAGAVQEIPLAAGRQLSPLTEVAKELAGQLEQSLIGQGLFPKEAAAMVATWRDSWFEEPGLRVLYLLPREWTDRVLPLALDPKPANLVRVMVGRAEVIPPAKERELLRQIIGFSSNEPEAKQRAVDHFQQLALGRFAEPAIRRVLGSKPDKHIADAAAGLTQAARVATSPTPLPLLISVQP